LATPAVVEAIPVRQAWRAATLGKASSSDKSAVRSGRRSHFARPVIINPRSIELDSE
jgi:hypothetical protein